jgi:hypothetical protein
MRNKEKWNEYMKEYRRKRRAVDKEYVERVRQQNAASERKRRAAKDDEIAALKAQIAALQAANNDNND